MQNLLLFQHLDCQRWGRRILAKPGETEQELKEDRSNREGEETSGEQKRQNQKDTVPNRCRECGEIIFLNRIFFFFFASLSSHSPTLSSQALVLMPQ